VTNPNLAPTIHSLSYLTLPEYCRVAGLDEEAVRDTLGASDVTWGGGSATFLTARLLAATLASAGEFLPGVPASIDPNLFVYLG
jgi:hypothetical protein